MTTTTHNVAEAVVDIRDQQAETFAARLLQSAAGAFEVFSIYIGDQLGFYEVLAHNGAMSSVAIAAGTGTSERYVREWLEQQPVAGLLDVLNPEASAMERLYELPEGHAPVLADRNDARYLAPLAQILAGVVRPLEALLSAFRMGHGVPYESYGLDLRDGQARMNRLLFLEQLGEEYLPSIPDVHARLQNGRPARVADIGCGGGWSSIGIAKSYPGVVVDGYDLDEASVQLARANAREEGVSDRVQFHVRDAADPSLSGRYDLVAAFECIHDMSRPVEGLETMRRLAKDDGIVIVMDERTSDRFHPPGNDIEWFYYGFSVLHCLPVGMVGENPAGTGTVMRPETFTRYARQAGFARVEILPIENFFFRFYRLHV